MPGQIINNPTPGGIPARIVNNQFNRIVNNSHIGALVNTGGPGWLPPPTIPPAGWSEVDGYDEEFQQDNSQATRIFIGPWITRYNLVQWALGWSYSVPNANNPAQGQLVRILPAQHPEFPWLFARRVKLVKGVGAWGNNPYVSAQDECGNVATNPTTGYALNPIPMICYFDPATGSDALSCVYAVTYQAVDFEIRDTSYLPSSEMSRWVTRNYTYAVQALSVPTNRLRFADGSGPISEGGIFVSKTQELTYLWREVPDVPEQAIQATIGHVNAAPFDGDPGFPTYPPGTLLCMAPEKTRHRGPTGRITWDISYKFLYRDNGTPTAPAGHNFFPNTSKQSLTWVLATFDGTPTGPTLYQPADFTQLFTVPNPANYQTPTLPSPACP